MSDHSLQLLDKYSHAFGRLQVITDRSLNKHKTPKQILTEVRNFLAELEREGVISRF